jgi:Ca2+-binding RTX toxin-like protein
LAEEIRVIRTVTETGTDTVIMQKLNSNTLTLTGFAGSLDGSTLTLGDAGQLKANAGGRTTLTGGNGEDYLLAGGSGDTLRGFAGDDWLIGGGGRDTIYGGAGDDTIYGGAGNDLLLGGAGADVYAYIAGENTGNDRIVGFSAGDTINIQGGSAVAPTLTFVNGDTTFSIAGGTVTVLGFSLQNSDFTFNANIV